jgi:hypothetical protein
MKIRLFANGGYANTSREEIIDFPDEEWNLKTEKEKEKFLEEEGWNFMQQCGIEFGAYVIEE